MVKVIRLDKRNYGGPKYNNLFKINNELAIATGMSVFNYIPKRRQLRKHIIAIHNTGNCRFPVSHKDIKRMERPNKCEVPVNIIDILEILICEIVCVKNRFNYRAQDENIISYHVLENTIEALRDFFAWLDAHPEGDRPECDKYREEVEYVLKRLEAFDIKYPGVFNSLFK